MSRTLLVLYSDAMRAKAHAWIDQAPKETRITFQAPKRSLAQNSRLWSCLGEIAAQVEHHGRKYDAETWKFIFMSALGKEMRFVPNLDGTGLIPIGHRSSELSKSEMSDLLELIQAFGAERGVIFHDPQEQAA